MDIPNRFDPQNGREVTPAQFERFRPMRLLVADDDALNRFVLESYLEEAGIACVFAKNGEEALDTLAREDFDAALIDLRMPVLDGLGFKAAYDSECASARRTPIPMATFSSGDVTPESTDAGFATHLAKPITFAALWMCLDRLQQAALTLPLV